MWYCIMYVMYVSHMYMYVYYMLLVMYVDIILMILLCVSYAYQLYKIVQ